MEISRLRFTYAVGDSEELRTGNWENLGIAKTAEGLEKYLSRASLLKPQFIGVYQQFAPPESQGEGEDYVDETERLDRLDSLPNSIMQLMLKLSTGLEDNVHPDLIHIAYGSGWNEDIVRMCFRDSVRRVKISPIELFPDFSTKNPETFFNLFFYFDKHHSNLTEASQSEKDKLKDYPNAARREYDIFGLTRLEYTGINSIQQISSGSRLITDPKILSVASCLPFLKQND